MATSTLSSKGQIVIPADVRADMGVDAGSRIEFVKSDAGWLIKPSVKPMTALKGILPKPKKRVSIEDMNRAIRRRAGR